MTSDYPDLGSASDWMKQISKQSESPMARRNVGCLLRLHVRLLCCFVPFKRRTPTVLGVVASVLAVVCKRIRQLVTTRNKMQQGVKTDPTCNIQQCWEFLANYVASVCMGVYLVVNYALKNVVWNLLFTAGSL